jgi:hypothetical protein
MLKHHQQRATDYRLLATQARQNALAALLPRVVEKLQAAAARWEALAELEDLIIKSAAARTAALEAQASSPG